MNWSITARRTALSLALCAVFSAAHAKTFDQTGPAPSSLAPLTTYGVDVATKTALKSVVPAGWQLFVHRGTQLPAAMSWRVGSTWPSALAEFVEGSDISVLVDWERKAVYFRPVTVALEDATKRAMVSQAATTPLPPMKVEGSGLKLATPELAKNATPPAPSVDPAAVASLEAKLHSLETQLSAAHAAKANADQEIVARFNALEATLKEKGATLQQTTTDLAAARANAFQAAQVAAELKAQQAATQAEMEARIQALTARTEPREIPAVIAAAPSPAVQAAPVAAATGSEAAPAVATAVMANAGHSAEQALPAAIPLDMDQYISLGASKSFNRAGVREVAEYVAGVHGLHLVMVGSETSFRGPVTVFGGDAAEDMRLMHKALGAAGGVSFELFRNERVLKVVSSSTGLKSYASVSEAAYSGPLPAMAQSAPASTAQVLPALTIGRIANKTPATAAVVHLAHATPAPTLRAPQASAVVGTPAAAKLPLNTPAPLPAASAPTATPASAASATPASPVPVLRLEIPVGEDLQTAVTTFLQKQGYETRWQVEELFEASNVFVGEGATVAEVLSLLLPKLGLSADIQSDAKRVTVRAADAVRDAK